MTVAVVTFPGSNCDAETLRAVEQVTGVAAIRISSTATTLRSADAVILPGGFSWGDYLRSGAMAAVEPIMTEVAAAAADGMPVLGICNGFQILCEAGLLPGALLPNASGRFTCQTVALEVTSSATAVSNEYLPGEIIMLPVAHADGRYHADPETVAMLEAEGRVVMRYAPGANPNGSVADIAGVANARGNVVGLMPHPERAIEPIHGNADGRAMFRALATVLGVHTPEAAHAG